MLYSWCVNAVKWLSVETILVEEFAPEFYVDKNIGRICLQILNK